MINHGYQAVFGRIYEAYAVWGLIAAGARGILGSLMGWMGVMSLMEAFGRSYHPL